MVLGILGRKVGMAQVSRDDGQMMAVTAIESGPCAVTQIKTKAREGYDAIQLGFGKAKHLNSPQRGHLREVGQFKYLREFRVDDALSFQVGQRIDVGLLNEGDLVDVTGVSKGMGFAGGVKRHHFAGGPKTHGQSDRHRAPGSIGAGTSPGRVLKGKRMAGHMGSERVTVRHLEVLKADTARNLLLVKGAVPGAKDGLLIIRKAQRGKQK